MSPPPAEKRDRALQLLLDAASRYPTSSHTLLEAEEYDWDDPAPAPEVLARLRAFGASFAERVGQSVTHALQGERTARVRLANYVFERTITAAEAAGDAFLVLTDEQGASCGALCVRSACARRWLDALFGGSGAGDEEGAAHFSPLERELLLDVFGAVASGLDRLTREQAGVAIGYRAAIQARFAPDEPDPSRDYGWISLTLDPERGEEDLSLFLRSDALAPILGIDDDGDTRSAEEVAADLRQHISEALVKVTLRVGRAKVPMRDLVNLQVGDVVVLDTRAGDPVSLDLDDEPVIAGALAQCDGLYALTVERSAADLVSQSDG